MKDHSSHAQNLCIIPCRTDGDKTSHAQKVCLCGLTTVLNLAQILHSLTWMVPGPRMRGWSHVFYLYNSEVHYYFTNSTALVTNGQEFCSMSVCLYQNVILPPCHASSTSSGESCSPHKQTTKQICKRTSALTWPILRHQRKERGPRAKSAYTAALTS